MVLEDADPRSWQVLSDFGLLECHIDARHCPRELHLVAGYRGAHLEQLFSTFLNLLRVLVLEIDQILFNLVQGWLVHPLGGYWSHSESRILPSLLSFVLLGLFSKVGLILLGW